MRKPFSSWNLRARLANRGHKAKSRRPGARISRSLRIEPLEVRQLLDAYSLAGTPGNDTFDVVIGPVNHQVRLNGGAWIDVARAQYDTIEVAESTGSDTLNVTGTSEYELASLDGDQSGLFKQNVATPAYQVTWSTVATVTINGNGGNDIGYLTDTAEDDTFTFAGSSTTSSNWGELTNARNTVRNRLNGFYYMHGYSPNGGNDRAVLTGTTGVDSLNRAYDGYGNCISRITNNSSYFTRALNYETVELVALAGADTLTVTGTAADETAAVESLGGQFIERADIREFITTWSNVPNVTIAGGGGYDRAYLFHSSTPGSDFVTQGTDWIRLTYPDFSYGEVSAFERVRRDSQVATGFDDLDLLDAVRASLGLPIDTLLTADLMLQLTSLTADSTLIDSLVGLEAATNLQSLVLVPSDLAQPGELAGLSPLTGLTQLNELVLQGLGLEDAELDPLGGLTSLKSLDLRHNEIAAAALPISFSNMTALEELDLRYNQVETIPQTIWYLPALSALMVYGNPLTDNPRTGLAWLARKNINVDLPPDHPERATTVAELAEACYNLPIKMYEYVVNTIEFQPYQGAMKGADAVIQTHAGNDWDTASLLAGLLAQVPLSSRYVSGRIEAPIQDVLDWLGAADPVGAERILDLIGNNATPISDAGRIVAMQFDHRWLEAHVGSAWIPLDPSWKLRQHRSEVRNMFEEVPFDPTPATGAYFATASKQLPHEYYEQEVREYLAANDPGVSIADIPYAGAIIPRSIDALPESLPYLVNTPTVIGSSIPSVNTHRVKVTLKMEDGTTLFNPILSLPEVSLKRITIEPYKEWGWINFMPRLRLDGIVIAENWTWGVDENSNVELILERYDGDGDNTVDATVTDTRKATDHIAIVLDANQVSPGLISGHERIVNEATITKANGGVPWQDELVGGLLHLAGLKYYYEANRAEDVMAGLTGGVRIQTAVALGITSGSSAVQSFQDQLQFSYLPDGLVIDLGGSVQDVMSMFDTTEYDQSHSSSLDALRTAWVDYMGSAMEHAVWEDLTNAASVSTVKSFQLARERSIPIYTIDSSNAATYMPQLTVSQSTKDHIQANIDAGRTVIVPRDPTPLGSWNGVGYQAGRASYISGGLAGQAFTSVDGGAITGTPATVNPKSNPAVPQMSTRTFASDPVDVASGTVVHDETDFAFPGLGFPLEFARHHQSSHTGNLNFDGQGGADFSSDRGMGKGWSFSYSDRLDTSLDTRDPAGTEIWYTGGGDRLKFEPNGTGGYRTPEGMFGQLATNVSGGYTWTDKTGSTVDFDSEGRLLRMQDRYGNGVVLSYYSDSPTSGQFRHIQYVRDLKYPDARYLTFTYDGILSTSHISSISDFTSPQRIWRYQYSVGRLWKAIAPSDSETLEAVVTYEYYTDTRRSGLLKKVIAPDGGQTTFTYYANRRGFDVTAADGMIHSFSYNIFRDRTELAEGRNEFSYYTHNDQGNVIEEVYPDRSSIAYTWNKSVKKSVTDPFGQTTTFDHDANGNLVAAVDPYENVAAYDYDATYSNVLKSVPLGRPDSQEEVVIDFTTMTLSNQYGGAPTGSYARTADELELTGDIGVAVTLPQAYQMTANTMLAFDFHASKEGVVKEGGVHAIGFDTDNTWSPSAHFQLFGTNTTAATLRDFESYAAATPGVRHYVIPVGQYYVQANQTLLTFFNDTTVAEAVSVFSNVRLFEASSGNQTDYDYYADGSLKTVTDALGNTTSYAYPAQSRGLPESVTLPKGNDLIGEAGTVVVTQASAQTWQTVPLNHSYNSPVVIVSPVSYGGITQVTARVRNVTSSSFEVQVDEWDYRDGIHNAETLYYVVMEAGIHELEGGVRIQAGTLVNVDHNWRSVSFGGSLDGTPVILAQTCSYDDGAAVTTRLRNVSSGGFEIRLQEEEAADGMHLAETVGYLAVEQGYGTSGGSQFEFRSPGTITSAWSTITFQQQFTAAPTVLANLQTFAGADTVVLRHRNLSTASVQMFAEEETSLDPEVSHGAEGLGYALFQLGDIKKAATADYQTTFEYNAAGQVTERRTRVEPGKWATESSDYSARGTLDWTTSGYYTDDAGTALGTGLTSNYTYDLLGRTLTVTLPDPDDFTSTGGQNGALPRPITTSTYDAIGNLITVSDTTGRITRFEYDLLQRPVKAINADGTYRTMQYAGNGNLMAETDELGRVMRYRYDARDRRIAVVRPDGGVVQTAYDVANHVVAQTNARGYTTRFEYDKLGRIVKEILPDPDGDGPLGETATSYGYDVHGNLQYVTDALGEYVGDPEHSTEYVYDAIGRRTEVILADPDDVGTGAGRPTTQTSYDANGNVLTVTDALGYVTSFTYDELGRKIRETLPDPDGTGPLVPPTSRWFYDARGNLQYVVNALGSDAKEAEYTTEYVRDNLWRVLREILPDPDGAGTGAGRPTTEYTYDSNGNLESEKDALNGVMRYRYDRRDRLAKVIDALAVSTGDLGHTTATWYDAVGNVQFVTDALGSSVGYQYDAMNRVTKETLPKPTVSGAQPEITYAYDSNGNLVSTVDALGFTTWYQYDGWNRQTHLTDALGYRSGDPPHTTVTRFDALGNVAAVTDPLGRTIDYSYDHLGRLTAEILPQFQNDQEQLVRPTTSYSYDAAGNLIALTDALIRTTRYQYDALGRTVSVTDALGAITGDPSHSVFTTYDALGNVIESKDQLGRVTSYQYDHLGRRTREILPDPDGQGVLLRPETKFAYDLAGNLVSITDPLEHSTWFKYDALNRRTHTIDALGSGPEDPDHATVMAYDAIGRVVSVTDAEDNTTTYAYDWAGRLRSESNPFGTRYYTFDAAGNLTRYADRSGRVTKYVHDPVGRVVEELWLDSSSQVIHKIHNWYDAAGQLRGVTETDTATAAAGTNYQYDYDALGNVTRSRVAPGDVTQPAPQVINGQLTEGSPQQDWDVDGVAERYAEHTFNWTAGNIVLLKLTSTSFDAALLVQGPGGGEWIVDNNSAGATDAYLLVNVGTTGEWSVRATSPAAVTGTYTLEVLVNAYPFVPTTLAQFTYKYDEVGNLQISSDTQNTLNEYDYDPLRRLEQARQSGTGIAAKRADFTYYNDSRSNTTTRYRDLAGTLQVATTTYGYDPLGRLNDLVHTAGGVTVADYGWNFDAASRITDMISIDGTNTLGYDNADQLTSATLTNESYTYDQNGNRTNTGYVTGDANRMTSDGVYSYVYDGEGNLVRRTRINGHATTRYVWDHRNRLIRVTEHADADPATPANRIIDYAYDSADRLVRRTLDNGGDGTVDAVAKYVYDGDEVGLEFNGSNALTHRYLWNRALDELLADGQVGWQTVWGLADHEGTIWDIVNSTGAVVLNHRKFDSFGRITWEKNAAIDVLFAYTGELLDEATGLQKHGARWYDPGVGRWLSEDPIGFDGHDANLYRYAGNSPLNNVDPSGMAYSGFATRSDTVLAGPFGVYSSELGRPSWDQMSTQLAFSADPRHFQAWMNRDLSGLTMFPIQGTPNYVAPMSDVDRAYWSAFDQSIRQGARDIGLTAAEPFLAVYDIVQPGEPVSQFGQYSMRRLQSGTWSIAITVEATPGIVANSLSAGFYGTGKGAWQYYQTGDPSAWRQGATGQLAIAAGAQLLGPDGIATPKGLMPVQIEPSPLINPGIPSALGSSVVADPALAAYNLQLAQLQARLAAQTARAYQAPRSPFHLSDAQLQAATDSIHIAEFGSGGGQGVPISVTVTTGGRVVVSQVGRVPGAAARARAIEIFGENVEFVRGTTGGNAPGPAGYHAEARGIQFLGNEAQGARQATSHYSCAQCEARQGTAGVTNVTGAQSQYGRISRPTGGN